MAGLKVVPVACDDPATSTRRPARAKADKHAADLAALMVTYPSTHGVFEEGHPRICEIIHEHGGQVYMDGANMNAQVGLTSPGLIGADVCHLNLHKTFCIPHGGGGPGVGPIGVARTSRPLPARPRFLGESAQSPARPPLGQRQHQHHLLDVHRHDGRRRPHRRHPIAILNANYIAKRLAPFPTLYTRPNGPRRPRMHPRPAPFKDSAGITVEDVAKRLMDYGYHAPTMSGRSPAPS
jgi:glycine dehydrogenase